MMIIMIMMMEKQAGKNSAQAHNPKSGVDSEHVGSSWQYFHWVLPLSVYSRDNRIPTGLGCDQRKQQRPVVWEQSDRALFTWLKYQIGKIVSKD